MNRMNFRNGNICRIYMKNFLTYQEIVIYPKPHLNVILGPNGTGKSSILCGICIGLGGKPSITGRGEELHEYIKHGKEGAVIEIELFCSESENLIIRREFTNAAGTTKKGNVQPSQSRWFIQNKNTTEMKVRESVRALGIQVDNLCQFLPQDRVNEFAMMNKIQLLSNTEKAIGKMDLFEQHEILANSDKAIKQKQAQLSDTKSQLVNETVANSKLEDQVKNIKMKEHLDKAIKELEAVIAFCEYNNCRKLFLAANQSIVKVKEEMSELQKRIEPQKQKILQIEEKMQKNLSETRKYNQKSKIYNTELENLSNKWDTMEEEIMEARNEYTDTERTNLLKEKELENLKKQLEVLKRELSHIKNVNEHEIKNLTSLITSKSSEICHIKYLYANTHAQRQALMDEKNLYEKRLNDAKDIHIHRLQILRTKNPPAFSAVQWLKSNRDIFAGMIHNPVFSLLNFSSPDYAKYMENTVSNKDLVAFICENKYDIKSLKQHMDHHRFPVNIFHSDEDNDPSKYKPMFPVEFIQSLGFISFLKDVVKAPPAIICYLCKKYNIHNIPFGLRANHEHLPSNFRIFFVGNKRYGRTMSRYDGQIQVSVSDLAEPKYMTNSLEQKEEEHLQKINELKISLNNVTSSLREYEAQEQAVENELENLRKEKQNITMIIDQSNTLKTRINQKQNQINRREESHVNLEEAEKQMHKKIEKIIGNLQKVSADMSALHDSVTEVSRLSLRTISCSVELHQEKQNYETSIVEEEEVFNKKKEELENFLKEKRTLSEKAKSLLQEFLQIVGIASIEDLSNEDKLYYNNENKSKKLEDLKAMLEDKKARRSCIITSEDNILNEYEMRKKKINELKEKEQKILEEIANENSSVEDCRNSWVPKIKKLTSNIDQHFSEFMANLGCAGEVQLDTGKDESDFSQYGLSIRVKFRSSERLRELTVHQQSGGERSVSTALYLMALQRLTAVPFRCVDEINQGMDPSNERKMFEMLVDSTTTANASQYFLITPKLLPNLHFNEYVNFMNTFNWTATTSNIRHLSVADTIKNTERKRKRRIN